MYMGFGHDHGHGHGTEKRKRNFFNIFLTNFFFLYIDE